VNWFICSSLSDFLVNWSLRCVVIYLNLLFPWIDLSAVLYLILLWIGVYGMLLFTLSSRPVNWFICSSLSDSLVNWSLQCVVIYLNLLFPWIDLSAVLYLIPLWIGVYSVLLFTLTFSSRELIYLQFFILFPCELEFTVCCYLPYLSSRELIYLQFFIWFSCELECTVCCYLPYPLFPWIDLSAVLYLIPLWIGV